MKLIMLIIGIVLILASLISMIQYVPIYSELSEFEKGVVFGKSLIFLLGVLFIYIGLRKKKNHNKG